MSVPFLSKILHKYQVIYPLFAPYEKWIIRWIPKLFGISCIFSQSRHSKKQEMFWGNFFQSIWDKIVLHFGEDEFTFLVIYSKF